MTVEVLLPHTQHHRRLDDQTYNFWLTWPLEEKSCSDCFRTLPIELFYARTRWPCGLPRTWFTYCKTCLRERTRFYARLRRRRQGIPVRNGGPYRIRGGHHESGYGDKVPIGPFAEWLLGQANQIDAGQQHMNNVAGRSVKSGIELLANGAGISVEYLRKISKEKTQDNHRNVTLGLVDRVLVAAKTSYQIHDLYPDH